MIITIKNIIIKNFRNIENLDLNFNSKLNSISGLNASNKTTILDAIRYVIFQKDESNSTIKNTNYIDHFGKISQINPAIELNLLQDDILLKLKFENAKWFINNIEQKNVTTYRETLSSILKLKELDLFFILTNPLLLTNKLVGETIDKSKIRNSIIEIANLISNSHIADSDEINKLISAISDSENKVKTNKKEIKAKVEQISSFKNANEEIKDWNVINSDNDNNNEKIINLNKLKKQHEIYQNYERQNEILSSEIKDIDNEQLILENNMNVATPNINNKIKWTIIDYILIFLTLGIWYFIKIKINKTKKINEAASCSDNIRHNKTKYQDNAKSKENKLEQMKKIQLKKGALNLGDLLLSIEEREKEIKLSKEEQIYIYQKKENLKQLELGLEDLDKKEIIFKDNLNSLKSEKHKIDQATKTIMNDTFKNFNIVLFNDDNEDRLDIYQNGIKWEYLNRANKLNIVFELNDFLKRKYNLNTFNLIDNCEAFNNLYESNNQLICASVTNENLKFNGSDIS